jgi:hypothetical protein
MTKRYIIVKDFFEAALGTWVILLIFELARPGMVQRFINLEYWFYALLILFICLFACRSKIL